MLQETFDSWEGGSGPREIHASPTAFIPSSGGMVESTLRAILGFELVATSAGPLVGHDDGVCDDTLVSDKGCVCNGVLAVRSPPKGRSLSVCGEDGTEIGTRLISIGLML